MAGMFNIWDAQQQRRADTQDIGKDYASLPEGRVAVSVLGQTGARLGGGMMKAAGFSNPDEERLMAIQEIKARFPNEPKTPQEYRTIGNALIDVAPEQAKLFFDQAKDLTDKSTTKKWQKVREDKRTDIRKEAQRMGYRLSEDDISAIANSSPDISQVSNTTDTFIHPWMDALKARTSQMQKDPEYASAQSAITPSSQPTATTNRKTAIQDMKELQSMNTSFGVEAKESKQNLNTSDTGIDLINQLRAGNTAAKPQLERMLARLNSDNRISTPEVIQVMKIGGLGDRITNSISTFMSGTLSPGTYDDIEEMFVRLAQMDQKRYNKVVSTYQSKYEPRFGKDTLGVWLPKNTNSYFTKDQQRERVADELKKRGLNK